VDEAGGDPNRAACLSAKQRGVTAPEHFTPACGDTCDAMDVHFKWYPSEVVRASEVRGVLVKFADLPSRFNAWIPLNAGRLAPLSTFTANYEQLPHVRGSFMVNGTTAEIPVGSKVETYSRASRKWAIATVTAVSEDGEVVSVNERDPVTDTMTAHHLTINDGCVRMWGPPAKVKKGRGGHRRSLSLMSGYDENITSHTLQVNIDAGKNLPLGHQARIVDFQVHDRYCEPIKFLGKGAYGCVISTFDKHNEEVVAIKKISGIQNMDHIDSMRTLREMKICRHLRGHENIVKLLHVVPQKKEGPLDEVYLIFEFMESDLGKFIRTGAMAEFPIEHQRALTQGFLYQMLRGMKYVHSAGIMHRDIKPSNLLINNEGDLKVADFGLAIGAAGASHQLISYVVTRWYRAPELLLDKKDYTFPVDLWSIGCILAEMLGCKPLFRGNSSRHQLHLILSVLGKPIPEDVSATANPRYHDMLNKMESRKAVAWSKLYPDAPPEALDLLNKLLAFNPDKRPTCEEALAHPYLDELRIPHDEPEHKLNFSYVTEDLEVSEIWKQINIEARLLVDEELSHHNGTSSLTNSTIAEDS